MNRRHIGILSTCVAALAPVALAAQATAVQPVTADGGRHAGPDVDWAIAQNGDNAVDRKNIR